MYVNYGRVEDYQWLLSNKSINVTGKIVIARYGKIFRGDKVMEGSVQWGMMAGESQNIYTIVYILKTPIKQGDKAVA